MRLLRENPVCVSALNSFSLLLGPWGVGTKEENLFLGSERKKVDLGDLPPTVDQLCPGSIQLPQGPGIVGEVWADLAKSWWAVQRT